MVGYTSMPMILMILSLLGLQSMTEGLERVTNPSESPRAPTQRTAAWTLAWKYVKELIAAATRPQSGNELCKLTGSPIC